jgi:hypothetical protein
MKKLVLKNDINEAILDYSPNNVYNCDETSAPCVDYPNIGWNIFKRASNVFTDGDVKKKYYSNINNKCIK